MVSDREDVKAEPSWKYITVLSSILRVDINGKVAFKQKLGQVKKKTVFYLGQSSVAGVQRSYGRRDTCTV